MSSGYEESRLHSFQDRPEEPTEKKVHLVTGDQNDVSICGLRAHKCEVFPLDEYLDWGYDGDGDDLCTRCDLKARQLERNKRQLI